MKKAKHILFPVIVGGLLIVLGFSIVQLWRIYGGYAQESIQHQELLTYKPAQPERTNSLVEGEKAGVNQSVIDLKERYSDTVGWLTIDGTKIDYPFVQAKDNSIYLRRDMDLNYLVSGTVFMDYRNAPDFTDFITILYGHNMKNNSMFGTMDWFREDDFFLENCSGRVYLPYELFELEIAAVLVISADDENVYKIGAVSDVEKQDFIAYIHKNAEQLRADMELTIKDNFLLLSTCVYDFDDARMVLVTKIVN